MDEGLFCELVDSVTEAIEIVAWRHPAIRKFDNGLVRLAEGTRENIDAELSADGIIQLLQIGD